MYFILLRRPIDNSFYSFQKRINIADRQVTMTIVFRYSIIMKICIVFLFITLYSKSDCTLIRYQMAFKFYCLTY